MALDALRIEKPVRKFRKLPKKMPRVPGVKEVHDLRTNSRRIEAELQALGLDSRRDGRHTLKRISQLRKRAGKVRDMDVLTGYVLQLPPRDDENDCAVQLLERLGSEHQSNAKKLHKTARRHGSKLNRRLKRIIAELQKALATNGNEILDGTGASARAAASALILLSELAKPARLSRTNLHPYRLKVKELRNLLRMSDKSDDRKFVEALGEVKDAIGEWHDWEELAAIAKKALTHGSSCRLVRELKNNADAKYEIALAFTETMRKQYLRVPGRRF